MLCKSFFLPLSKRLFLYVCLESKFFLSLKEFFLVSNELVFDLLCVIGTVISTDE